MLEKASQGQIDRSLLCILRVAAAVLQYDFI